LSGSDRGPPVPFPTASTTAMAVALSSTIRLTKTSLTVAVA
jgi:hypothetical protein